MAHARFTKGSATFICDCCGHNTRNTGVQSVDSKLCPACWELAGLENALSDDGEERFAAIYADEVNVYFAEIRARSDAEYKKARQSFDTLIPYINEEAFAEQTEPVAVETDHSVAKGPVAICRAIFAANPEISRKAFIASATEKGVLLATARTQFSRIKKEA